MGECMHDTMIRESRSTKRGNSSATTSATRETCLILLTKMHHSCVDISKDIRAYTPQVIYPNRMI